MRKQILILISAIAVTGCVPHDDRASKGELFAAYAAPVEAKVNRLPGYEYTEAQNKEAARLNKVIGEVDTYRTTQGLAEALAGYKKVLSEYEQAFAADDAHITRPLHRLYECSLENQKYADGEAYARRLLSIRDKWLGVASSDSAEAVSLISRALRLQNKPELALTETQARMAELQKVPLEDCAPGMVLLLCEQADIYQTLNRPNDAIASLDKALEARKLVAPGISAPPKARDILLRRQKLST